MSGTVAGGKAAAIAIKEKYGDNFYREAGRSPKLVDLPTQKPTTQKMTHATHLMRAIVEAR